VGDLRIPVRGQETTWWSDYSAKLLTEVIQSWVDLVESGRCAHYVHIGEDQPTTEHLRVAKSFLG
jgi:hypothetical protein